MFFDGSFVFINTHINTHTLTYIYVLGKFIKVFYKTYVVYELQIPRSKGNAN